MLEFVPHIATGGWFLLALCGPAVIAQKWQFIGFYISVGLLLCALLIYLYSTIAINYFFIIPFVGLAVLVSIVFNVIYGGVPKTPLSPANPLGKPASSPAGSFAHGFNKVQKLRELENSRLEILSHQPVSIQDHHARDQALQDIDYQIKQYKNRTAAENWQRIGTELMKFVAKRELAKTPLEEVRARFVNRHSSGIRRVIEEMEERGLLYSDHLVSDDCQDLREMRQTAQAIQNITENYLNNL